VVGFDRPTVRNCVNNLLSGSTVSSSSIETTIAVAPPKSHDPLPVRSSLCIAHYPKHTGLDEAEHNGRKGDQPAPPDSGPPLTIHRLAIPQTCVLRDQPLPLKKVFRGSPSPLPHLAPRILLWIAPMISHLSPSSSAHSPRSLWTGIIRAVTSVLILAGLQWSNTDASLAGEIDRPNIVFILADDLGYGELGCYGQQKIKTPNLDRLATQGVRMTQHYSGAPVCAPARCTLMTGLHLGHAEIRGNRDSGNGRVFPGQWPITDQAMTIAEVLHDAGYATGAFGKWGLGPSNTSGSPIKQGFDRYYGYNCQRNAHSFYPPFLDSDEKEVRINRYPIPGHDRKPQGEVVADDYRAENYAPDLILGKALQFIRQHKAERFFAYIPLTEPHVAC